MNARTANEIRKGVEAARTAQKRYWSIPNKPNRSMMEAAERKIDIEIEKHEPEITPSWLKAWKDMRTAQRRYFQNMSIGAKTRAEGAEQSFDKICRSTPIARDAKEQPQGEQLELAPAAPPPTAMADRHAAPLPPDIGNIGNIGYIGDNPDPAPPPATMPPIDYNRITDDEVDMGGHC